MNKITDKFILLVCFITIFLTFNPLYADEIQQKSWKMHMSTLYMDNIGGRYLWNGGFSYYDAFFLNSDDIELNYKNQSSYYKVGFGKTGFFDYTMSLGVNYISLDIGKGLNAGYYDNYFNDNEDYKGSFNGFEVYNTILIDDFSKVNTTYTYRQNKFSNFPLGFKNIPLNNNIQAIATSYTKEKKDDKSSFTTYGFLQLQYAFSNKDVDYGINNERSQFDKMSSIETRVFLKNRWGKAKGLIGLTGFYISGSQIRLGNPYWQGEDIYENKVYGFEEASIKLKYGILNRGEISYDLLRIKNFRLTPEIYHSLLVYQEEKGEKMKVAGGIGVGIGFGIPSPVPFLNLDNTKVAYYIGRNNKDNVYHRQIIFNIISAFSF